MQKGTPTVQGEDTIVSFDSAPFDSFLHREYRYFCQKELMLQTFLKKLQTHLDHTNYTIDQLQALQREVEPSVSSLSDKCVNADTTPSPSSYTNTDVPNDAPQIHQKMDFAAKNDPRNRMSLFVDGEGHSMPSNADAIKLWSLRHSQKLPNYRRKYDWKVALWSEAEAEELRVKATLQLRQWILNHLPLNVQMCQKRTELGTAADRSVASVLEDGSLVCQSEGEAIYNEINKLENFDLIFKAEDVFKELQSTALQDDPSLLTLEGEDPEVKSLSQPIQKLQSFWKGFWETVASQLGGKHIFTPQECRVKFLQHCEQRCNQAEWSIEEDKHLLYVISQVRKFDWWEIARRHNHSRTPFGCFGRYQKALNTQIHRYEWTQEEDEQLKKVVYEIGSTARGPCKWNHVAAHLPGRTIRQCRARWTNSIEGSVKQACFSPYEDVKLQLLVCAYGRGNWGRVALHLPGRTDVKCRERYENILYPKLRKGRWSDEESQQLLEAIGRFGYTNWSNVQECIPGRTDSDCARQWQRLEPNKHALIRAFSSIRRLLNMKGNVRSIGKRSVKNPNSKSGSFESAYETLSEILQVTTRLTGGEDSPVDWTLSPNYASLVQKLRTVSKYLQLFLQFDVSQEAQEKLDALRQKIMGILLEMCCLPATILSDTPAEGGTVYVQQQLAVGNPLTILMEVYELLFPLTIKSKQFSIKAESNQTQHSKKSKRQKSRPLSSLEDTAKP